MNLDLRQLLRIGRRWWWFLLLAPLLAAGTAYWSISRQAPLYSSTATLLITPTQSAVNPYSDPVSQLEAGAALGSTYERLVTTEPILSATIAHLGLPLTINDLRLRVEANAIVNTQLLEISVSDTDPAMAATIANTVAAEFADHVSRNATELSVAPSQEIDQQLADTELRITDLSAQIQALENSPTADDPSVQGEINALETSLNEARSVYSDLLFQRQQMALGQVAAQNLLRIWEPAQVPSVPYAPRTTPYTLLALVAGFLIAAGTIVIIEYLDNTVKPETNLVGLVGAPLLSTVRRVPKLQLGLGQLFVLSQPKSGAAEAIRLLRTNLEFAAATKEITTLAVTSPDPGDGKSTITANLATAIAQAGYSVIILDADLRRPTQHRIFEVRNDSGLTTLLTHHALSWRSVTTRGVTDGLLLIPSGPIPPNPADLLTGDRFRRLLVELSEAADIVLIDTPPVLAASDPLIVGTEADGMVVVCQAGRTRTDALRRAGDVLRQGGIRLVGVVLNQQAERKGEGYYYGYYGQDSEPKRQSILVSPVRASSVTNNDSVTARTSRRMGGG